MMTHSPFRHSWLLMAAIVLVLGAPCFDGSTLHAQTATPVLSQTPPPQPAGTPVVFADETLFVIFDKIGPFTPEERARAIAERLTQLAKDPFTRIYPITAVDQGTTSELIYGEMVVMTVTDRDAQPTGKSRQVVATDYAAKIQAALAKSREQLSARSLKFDLLYYPGINEDETNVYIHMPSNEYFASLRDILNTDKRNDFTHNYIWDISAGTDDKPFFSYYLKTENIRRIYIIAGGKWQYFVEEGYILPIVFVQIAVASLFLILLPIFIRGKPHKGNSSTIHRFFFLSYFALIGIGFMFIEVPLIQKMILPFGHTRYAFAAVLISILISSGAGSVASYNIRHLRTPFVLCIVLFNAEMMACMSHVRSALRHAFRAFDQGTAISNSPEMEALLYASGTRQCRSGLRFGIHPGKNMVYLCVCPGNRKALEDLLKDGTIVNEDWNILSPEKVKRLTNQFGITVEELEVAGRDRITDLILERVALLEVYR